MSLNQTLSGATVDGRFQIIKRIGKGAFGVVYLAHDRNFGGQAVVVKCMDLTAMSAEDKQSATQEAKLLQVLTGGGVGPDGKRWEPHPNLVQYVDAFEAENQLLIVMEYCERGDLSARIKQAVSANQPFPEDEVMDWFAQICLAVHHIHSRKVLHRDLKTQNIFLTKKNVVKLGDFGVARLMNTQSLASTVLGTPYYMSPELCHNRPYSFKSDVWAMGCILFELLTLRRPFAADNFPALILKIMTQEVPDMPRASEGVQGLVRQMLDKDPDKRPLAREVLQHPAVNRALCRIRSMEGTLGRKVDRIYTPKEAMARRKEQRRIEHERRLAASREAALLEKQQAQARARQQLQGTINPITGQASSPATRRPGTVGSMRGRGRPQDTYGASQFHGGTGAIPTGTLHPDERPIRTPAGPSGFGGQTASREEFPVHREVAPPSQAARGQSAPAGHVGATGHFGHTGASAFGGGQTMGAIGESSLGLTAALLDDTAGSAFPSPPRPSPPRTGSPDRARAALGLGMDGMPRGEQPRRPVTVSGARAGGRGAAAPLARGMSVGGQAQRPATMAHRSAADERPIASSGRYNFDGAAAGPDAVPVTSRPGRGARGAVPTPVSIPSKKPPPVQRANSRPIQSPGAYRLPEGLDETSVPPGLGGSRRQPPSPADHLEHSGRSDALGQSVELPGQSEQVPVSFGQPSPQPSPQLAGTQEWQQQRDADEFSAEEVMDDYSDDDFEDPDEMEEVAGGLRRAAAGGAGNAALARKGSKQILIQRKRNEQAQQEVVAAAAAADGFLTSRGDDSPSPTSGEVQQGGQAPQVAAAMAGEIRRDIVKQFGARGVERALEALRPAVAEQRFSPSDTEAEAVAEAVAQPGGGQMRKLAKQLLVVRALESCRDRGEAVSAELLQAAAAAAEPTAEEAVAEAVAKGATVSAAMAIGAAVTSGSYVGSAGSMSSLGSRPSSGRPLRPTSAARKELPVSARRPVGHMEAGTGGLQRLAPSGGVARPRVPSSAPGHDDFSRLHGQPTATGSMAATAGDRRVVRGTLSPAGRRTGHRSGRR